MSNSKNMYSLAKPKQGYALVFINEKFDDPELDDRTGAQVDSAHFKLAFEACGLQVNVYQNTTDSETLTILNEFAKNQERASENMMAVAFSTHGHQITQSDIHKDILHFKNKNGFLTVNAITKIFRDDVCKGMAGKPKMFFIQACRGDNLDETVQLNQSGECEPMTMTMQNCDSKTVEIPIAKDFYLACCTPPGNKAFRNPKEGSWFVRCLHEVFLDNMANCDLVALLGLVRNKMAITDDKCMVRSPSREEPYHLGRKNTPWSVSMLTKDVWFKEQN